MFKKILIIFLCNNLIYGYKLGLENSNLNDILQNKRIALITNQSGLDQNKNRNIDIFKKDYKLNYILVPEHGLTGIKAGDKVGNSVDRITKIPIISLYTGNSKTASLDKDKLNNIDVIVFDIQDSGMRHFTYISTMLRAMQMAQRENKEFVVLDRPNPLGGIVEGPLVDDGQKSFVSIASIPLRHGMTVGEIAKYFNEFVLEKPINLTIVPMQNYKREMCLPEVLTYVSPRLQENRNLYGYSFLGLFENIKPFKIDLKNKDSFVGLFLPQNLLHLADWKKVIQIFKKHNVNAFVETYCIGKKCFDGVEINFNDINRTYTFSMFLDLVDFFKSKKIDVSFEKIFHLCIGTKDFEKYWNNQITRKQFVDKINKELTEFNNKTKHLLIYGDLKINRLS